MPKSARDRICLPALNLIHRRVRLLNVLEHFVEAGQRLITVYAPNGYGKSILLADFAQTTNLPICWCSLETVDRDPSAFLTLLTYSLTDRFHQIEPNELLDIVARGETETSISYITEAMNSVGPHIVIVDDYHKATSASWNLTINRLLKKWPKSGVMIFASRYPASRDAEQIIQLPLGEQKPTLAKNDLRFTPKEIQGLMRKRFGCQMTLDEAEEIAQITEGNIAQILLAGHAMEDSQIFDGLRQRLGDNQKGEYRHLTEEIFSKQPPELQHFMLSTSVLPYLTKEMCDEVLGIINSQDYIAKLLRKDLIVQTGAQTRYDDFFGEFLRAELAKDKRLYRQVATTAAEVLTTQAEFEESMQLYLSLNAWNEAITLLEDKGNLLYNTGHALTLYSWLTQIPERMLDQHPGLLLLQGQILNDDLSKPRGALSLFEKAEKQFCRQNNLIGLAEARIWKSVGERAMGQVSEALTLSSEALTQLETINADERLVGWALENYNSALLASGNINEALSHLRYTLKLFDRLGDTYYVGICHHNIGVCLRKQGNTRAAEHHYQQALRIWEALGNANNLASTLSKLGSAFCDTGRYKEALQKLHESLEIAHQIKAIHQAASAQAGIGNTYLESGKYNDALEAFITSLDLATQAEAHSLEIYSMVKLGECFYHQHNLTHALAMAHQAKEIAVELGLVYEKGLACVLQGRVYMRQGQYRASFALFAEALEAFAENDVLEQAKVRLWWASSLLLDLRSATAFEQLKTAIQLILSIGELKFGLGQALRETRQLLLHFLHRMNTPSGIRDSILMLLEQTEIKIDVSKPSLQFFTFGIPMLIVAGERRQFFQRGKINKLPEMLAYLSTEGRARGCRWVEVSDALWPDMDPERASKVFHQNIRRLRDIMAPDYIIVQDDYYQINPYYFEWCDVLAFERLSDRIAKLSSEETFPLQLELIDLYQGDFLAGFDLAEWGIVYRSQYERQFLQVVRLTGEQFLNKGAPWKALDVLNKGLAQDYFREDLHYCILKACAQLGLYGELRKHYARLQEIFQQELGCLPGPDIKNLYEQLTG